MLDVRVPAPPARRRARLVLCGLAAAVVAAIAPAVAGAATPLIVTGLDAGATPLVSTFDGKGAVGSSFLAYDQGFGGGVRVATGDVNGDGIADIITGAGAGAGPHVKVFDGKTGATLMSFFAYAETFLGGVYVAAGDVNGDGLADIVTGAGAGAGPHVKVFDGRTGTELQSFFAFAPTFLGGVRVAAGDVNGDGRADIIAGAGAGGGPHVQVFNGRTGATLMSFFAFDAGFLGGVYVAAGDVNGDARADIITGAGAGGGPHVKVFDGKSGGTLQSFDAYASTFTGGVRVAAGDVNGDGAADIITGAGGGGSPHVSAFSGRGGSLLASFLASSENFFGGVYVAGGPKAATERLGDLHALITSFRLEKGLNAFFQNKVDDIRLAIVAGGSPCERLAQPLLAAIAKAGKERGMLQYSQAQALVAAVNDVGVGLGCVSPGSPMPGVENALIGLLDVVDSAKVKPGEQGVLIGLLRKAGGAAVGGSPCQALHDISIRLAADAGRQGFSELIGLLLPAVQVINRNAGCLAS